MNATIAKTSSRSLWRLGAFCASWALLGAPAFGQEGEEPVTVTDYGTVTLAVQDTDLAQVLEMLSIQSEKNIISSKNVSATISANLYDVTFYEALDAILKVNGYDYVEEGNFIYIYTQAELEEMEQARRTTESRIFELDHLSATDAHEFITPLLSESGQSSYRGDVEPGIEPDSSDAGADSYPFAAKLVVNDYAENLDDIAALLEQLDVPPQQLLLEATILNASVDETNAFGIDFTVLGNVNFTDLTSPLAGVNNLLAGSDDATGFQPDDNKAAIGTSSPGNTEGPGTLKIGILKDDIAVFLKVLDEVTDATVLARPKIMCLNRQRAEVLVGARVGYLSTTATETSTTQSVEFLDTGIQLQFRPFISRNGMIRLELSPSVSEASLRSVTDAQGLSVTIPDELTNEITTNVRVSDGETLVLGGLFREANQRTRRQVPLLGDIPIVGAAFRGHDDIIDRQEILFLITPNIVQDEVLWAAGDEVMEYADSAMIGARAGLLPFSRDKMTADHNSRAIDAFNRGDLETSLYHINNSLRLNPSQQEMIRFRERIMGIDEMPQQRNILERVFREHLGDVAFVPVGDETSFPQRTLPEPTTTFAEPKGTPPAGRGETTSPSAANTTERPDSVSRTTTEAPWSTAPVRTPTPVVTVPTPAPEMQEGFTWEDESRLIDRFVNDYFRAVGLSSLSPAPSSGASTPMTAGELREMEQKSSPAVKTGHTGSERDGYFPFETFEDMPEMDLIEANADEAESPG